MDNPKAGTAPAGPGVQAPLEMCDLAVTLGRLTDRVEHRVVPLNERDQIGVVALVGDTLSVLIPVQQAL